MQAAQANARTPYKFTAILEEGSDSADVQAVAIPPRPETPITETPETDPNNPNGIERGMKCSYGRHTVRVEAIDTDEGIAEVYPLNQPHLVGPAALKDLHPVATPVSTGDKVLLWAGEGRPVMAVVSNVDGDTAQFFSPVYKESLWLHTSLIVSTSPRTSRR